MDKPIVALMYDFDKTLAITDMQNFSFIPSLGYTPEQFWSETTKFCQKMDIDRVLGYMYMMMDLANKKNIKLTREFLNEQGKSIKYFRGVEHWFKRISEYGEEKGLKVEHYLITSGNKEIVEGTSIFKEFKQVFGCEYIYDEEAKTAKWPKTMINYTQKTQYIFRISKGLIESNDDREINEKTPIRRVLYENMIYLGDGLTDVPSMIVVKENGGSSIAVYKKGERDLVSHLFEDGRVNYICKADYGENSELDKVVKLIIDGIQIKASLEKRRQDIRKEL
ncbi:MAG: haloacid dehalogenase-like hydrolase [Firmicutes bacterium]|uniref:Haloacid dehalogenase-like hydrolase n=1 Tax=Candidatus Onthovivens merdipullorum TaxID=2840889 RepID=A0A9D9DGD0_9BACL|nr:haloacid dehalogenase-like hydrolase [Candidatus Onthovivens merdipullorum]